MIQEIEKVIDQQIRPQLATHGGDIRVLSFEDGVVRFELLGRCSGCPAANITTEELIRETLRQEVAAVKDVVLVEEVDEDLVDQARAILRRPRC